jgi:hypothetical protein
MCSQINVDALLNIDLKTANTFFDRRSHRLTNARRPVF